MKGYWCEAMGQSLKNTKWICVEEDMEECGTTCTVIHGEIDPDANGDNDIEIQYEDGSIAYMKLRRFIFRFEPLHRPLTIKEKRAVLGNKIQEMEQVVIGLKSEMVKLQDEGSSE